MLSVDVITLFPGMFAPVLGESILKRGQAAGCLQVNVHDLREYTHDKRRTVDDRPYGGGPGMVLKPEPVFEAVEAVERARHGRVGSRPQAGCQIMLMSPAGTRLTQALAQEFSRVSHLV